jgi:hypothetical protein
MLQLQLIRAVPSAPGHIRRPRSFPPLWRSGWLHLSTVLSTRSWCWLAQIVSAGKYGDSVQLNAHTQRSFIYRPTYLATSSRSTGSRSAVNQGWRLSQPLLRQEGCGNTKVRGSEFSWRL